MDDSNVVFECDNVGFGECSQWRQIGRLGINRAKKVLGEADRVDPEVGLEDKIRRVIDSPFARFLDWGTSIVSVAHTQGRTSHSPITQTQSEHSIDDAGSLLQVRVLLNIGSYIILEPEA